MQPQTDYNGLHLSHEGIGEKILAYTAQEASELYDAMAIYLQDTMGTEAFNDAIQGYIDRYNKAGKKADFSYALYEYMNDSLVGIFSTEKGQRDFVENLTKNEDKSLIDKFKELFNRLLNKVHQLVEDMKKNNMYTEGALKLMEAGEEQLQEWRDEVFRLLDLADVRAEGTSNEEAMAASLDNTQYSLKANKQSVTVVNGTPIISGNAFSSNLVNKSYKEVTEAIQNELRKLTNNKYIISSDNREVYIGNDFADEYKGSTDTWSKNIVRRKAKANAIGGIEKIIETAQNPRWTKNTETKHNNDAQRGWTYYDIRFGIENPSNNAITYYEGILNVRMDSDGQDYVYDITKIKKENLSHSKGGNKISSPSNPSIPSSTENATTTSSGAFSLDVDSEGRELTEGQKEYFKDSKAIDYEDEAFNGEKTLATVYHGTVREFYEFDKDYANVEGNVGAGYYFTNSDYDVKRNYANKEGQDLTNKLEREADKLEGTEGYEDKTHEEILDELKNKYITSDEPIKLECYLNIKNPVYIATYNGKESSANINIGRQDTLLFTEDDLDPGYDVDDFESEEEYQEEVDAFIENELNDIIYQVDNSEEIAGVVYDAFYNGGITFEDLKKELNNLYLEDEEGNFNANEVAR